MNDETNNKGAKKFRFKKFQITKINNPQNIIGGQLDNDDDRIGNSMNPKDCLRN